MADRRVNPFDMMNRGKFRPRPIRSMAAELVEVDKDASGNPAGTVHIRVPDEYRARLGIRHGDDNIVQVRFQTNQRNSRSPNFYDVGGDHNNGRSDAKMRCGPGAILRLENFMVEKPGKASCTWVHVGTKQPTDELRTSLMRFAPLSNPDEISKSTPWRVTAMNLKQARTVTTVDDLRAAIRDALAHENDSTPIVAIRLHDPESGKVKSMFSQRRWLKEQGEPEPIETAVERTTAMIAKGEPEDVEDAMTAILDGNYVLEVVEGESWICGHWPAKRANDAILSGKDRGMRFGDDKGALFTRDRNNDRHFGWSWGQAILRPHSKEGGKRFVISVDSASTSGLAFDAMDSPNTRGAYEAAKKAETAEMRGATAAAGLDDITESAPAEDLLDNADEMSAAIQDVMGNAPENGAGNGSPAPASQRPPTETPSPGPAFM